MSCSLQLILPPKGRAPYDTTGDAGVAVAPFSWTVLWDILRYHQLSRVFILGGLNYFLVFVFPHVGKFVD